MAGFKVIAEAHFGAVRKNWVKERAIGMCRRSRRVRQHLSGHLSHCLDSEDEEEEKEDE